MIYMIPFNRTDSRINISSAFIKGYFRNYISSLEEAFARYIGKEHALFTNSCRSALYLAYKSLKLEGEVIVTPLTCAVAILPIICAGLKPQFVDIDPKTLNVDPQKINEFVTNKTCAIQAIHIGGNPCNMRAIKEIAEDYNLTLIEDCAQSLGAEYEGRKVGYFGDISCFNLSKNMYGIGGGIVMANDQNVLLKAKDIQDKFDNISTLFIYYRSIRNIMEKSRGNSLGNAFHSMLMSSRKFSHRCKKVIKGEEDCNFLQHTMHIPTNIEASIAYSQFGQLEIFLKRRVENALILSEKIQRIPEVEPQTITKNAKHVFTRFMIKTPYNSKDIIKRLNEKGVEAKHLAQKYGSMYQERFDRNPLFSHFGSIKNCENYLEVHDNVVTLPMSSNMKRIEIVLIENRLSDILKSMDTAYKKEFIGVL